MSDDDEFGPDFESCQEEYWCFTINSDEYAVSGPSRELKNKIAKYPCVNKDGQEFLMECDMILEDENDTDSNYTLENFRIIWIDNGYTESKQLKIIRKLKEDIKKLILDSGVYDCTNAPLLMLSISHSFLEECFKKDDSCRRGYIHEYKSAIEKIERIKKRNKKWPYSL